MSETKFRVTERPKHFVEYEDDGLMSNFDGIVDYSIADAIKGKPLYSRYAGWNFNGKVWWDDKINQWICEVWQYHSVTEYVVKSTLEEIMETVCEKYGNQ